MYFELLKGGFPQLITSSTEVRKALLLPVSNSPSNAQVELLTALDRPKKARFNAGCSFVILPAANQRQSEADLASDATT